MIGTPELIIGAGCDIEQGLISTYGVNRMVDRWYAKISSSMIKISGSPRDSFECYSYHSRKWRGC